MTKVINTENFIKGIFTKSEIRYIQANKMVVVLESMVPVGCKFKKQGWGQNANVIEITITDKQQQAQLLKACEKRAKVLRSRMPDVDEWCKEQDAIEAAARKAKREEEAIGEMLKADGLYGVWSTLHTLRLGENTDKLTARYAKENSIECDEFYDNKNGYARSCKFTMVRRSFYINIRRGYHLFRIGGLLTFIKGSTINREGMACEWVEQGKSIADIRTVKGWLVRGEHIVAKTLKEAQAINAEHRAMQLARLLNARKRAERRAEQRANGTLRITFQDSIEAGNCRPGTSEFKHQYEAAIGHEAKDISIADLRKYAKQFGVEYYAEKAIQYALNH